MQIKYSIAIVVIASTLTFPQTGQFFDAPFGGGIGYVPAWYIPNVKPVNDFLPSGMPL